MKSVMLTCVFAVFLIGTWQVMDARHKMLVAKLHLMAESQLAMDNRLESLEDKHDALQKAVCGDISEQCYYVAMSNGLLRAITETPSGLPQRTVREELEAMMVKCRYLYHYSDNCLKRQERWLARFREGLKEKKEGEK